MVKKRYSINWENDEPVSFEVDGILYEHIEDIPDGRDRSKVEAMMDASFEEEFEQESEKKFDRASNASFDPEKLILAIFSAVAAVMLLVAGISTSSAIRKLWREESSPGRVVDVVMRRVYINEEDRIIQEYYYPVVYFASSDGKTHTVQLTEGSSPPSHQAGDEVTVLYEPDNPSDARIKSFASTALNFILPAITGVIGIGFLAGVIAVRRLISSDQPG